MSQDNLTKYYLLCTMRMGTKAHVVSELSSANMEIMFTKREINLFLRRVGDGYVAREVVIGGGDQHRARRPIIVID